jgi:transketolase
MTMATALGYEDLPRLFQRMTGDEKHDPSSLSTLDVLWVLYDRVLEEDDRFLLSKGHGPMAYYAVLAAKGYFPEEWLDDFGSFDSPLGHHPDSARVPGVEIASGSLGHALGGRRVYCLVGDGELDEGSNWEAIQYAGRVGLERLTVAVVDNSTATHGWPGGIEARFLLEGWTAERVDGRDHDALERAFRAGGAGRPHAMVAEVRE